MYKKKKNGILVGLFTGVIIVISECVNFKIQGYDYNFGVFVLITACVAVLALIILSIILYIE